MHGLLFCSAGAGAAAGGGTSLWSSWVLSEARDAGKPIGNASMSGGAPVLFFALGGGSLALWIDARFPTLMPAELRRVMFHLLAAMVVAQLALPPIMNFLEGSQVGTLAGLFGAALPALIYCFLVSIWVIKTFQSSLRHR